MLVDQWFSDWTRVKFRVKFRVNHHRPTNYIPYFNVNISDWLSSNYQSLRFFLEGLGTCTIVQCFKHLKINNISCPLGQQMLRPEHHPHGFIRIGGSTNLQDEHLHVGISSMLMALWEHIFLHFHNLIFWLRQRSSKVFFWHNQK